MFWLMVAKGMAWGMIVGGILAGAALLFAENDLAWFPLALALAAGCMLGLIEREVGR